MPPTKQYTTRSVRAMAQQLAEAGDAYVPLSDYPTLELRRSRPVARLLVVLGLLLAAGGAGILAGRHTHHARPACDDRVTDCP